MRKTILNDNSLFGKTCFKKSRNFTGTNTPKLRFHRNGERDGGGTSHEVPRVRVT